LKIYSSIPTQYPVVVDTCFEHKGKIINKTITKIKTLLPQNNVKQQDYPSKQPTSHTLLQVSTPFNNCLHITNETTDCNVVIPATLLAVQYPGLVII
jgi:hypothetical protein